MTMAPILPVVAAFIAGWAMALLFLKGAIVSPFGDAQRRRFRVMSRRLVKPLGQYPNVRYPLSVLDKTLCPVTVINMTYVYEATLDAEKLQSALAKLITEQPFLAGSLSGWLKHASVACDGSGVELVLAESSWRFSDIHYASRAFDRLSQYEACGFGAASGVDVLAAVLWKAPVMRARVTYLSGGGTALSVSVAHTVLDAKSAMKVIEMWARLARGEQSLPAEERAKSPSGISFPLSPGINHVSLSSSAHPQNGHNTTTTTGTSSTSNGNHGAATAAAAAATSGVERIDDLTPPPPIFLQPPLLDSMANAHSSSPKQSNTMVVAVMDACNMLRQAWFTVYVFLIAGLTTKTFFFSDDHLAKLKDAVMANIRAAQGDDDGKNGSSGLDGSGTTCAPRKDQIFVSTNDVLCATIWKAIQGLRSRPPGTSIMHMNMDVRNLMMKGESFFMGNGVIQVDAECDDPAVAPVEELSVSIRRAIAGITKEEATRRLAVLKRKERLGTLLGPMGLDWRFTHDVIFSPFHPLQSDHDFGQGSAVLYHLDLVPALSMYNHVFKGVELDGRPGLYVQMTLPVPSMRELVLHHPDFLPPRSAHGRRASKSLNGHDVSGCGDDGLLMRVVEGDDEGEEEEEEFSDGDGGSSCGGDSFGVDNVTVQGLVGRGGGGGRRGENGRRKQPQPPSPPALLTSPHMWLWSTVVTLCSPQPISARTAKNTAPAPPVVGR